MTEQSAFLELIRRVRAGDEEAARELVERYEPAIRRVARVRLVDSRLRRILDSMDICQSVFASFFVRAALGQYELDRPENVLRLLVTIAHKKLADHARAEGAAKRDYRRRRSDSSSPVRLVAAGSTPGEQVAMEELLMEFRKRLSAEERALADRRAQGQDWAQIAAEHGQSPEALRKRLTRAVDRVAQELQLDEISHG